MPDSDTQTPDDGSYVVIARRYRPQSFEELIGQEHVARAMAGAISTDRVGHAYLFSGARGVGKTSAARILAKCLNCVEGPTPTPCNECDICLAVSQGGDVDVIEIDGASNRGVDEIRQLRQNVAVRPSRARYKIYIIDEVHMLTREAFNALLKTLEEPPEHVKFIFCTTEPEKVPITIQSRCQRFDFAGIRTPSIVERLAAICAAEGVAAEREALEIIARRAAGSMRDSQSLLEQVLSCCGEKLTPHDVHALIGTAASGRIDALVGHLAKWDAAAALAELDSAVAEGVDVGQLIDQLIGYFRDALVAAVGGSAESFLHATSSQTEQVAGVGKVFGIETLLAVMQILDQALVRMRQSTHNRTLAEMAIVRICHLEDLDELAALAEGLRGGAAASAPAGGAAAVKKKLDDIAQGATAVLSSNGAALLDKPAVAQVALTPESVMAVWQQALATMNDMVADQAGLCEQVTLAGPRKLVVAFKPKYAAFKQSCERPEQAAKLERAVAAIVGEPVRVEFAVLDGQSEESAAPLQRAVSPRQLIAEKSQHPLVRRAMELFDATPIRVDGPETAAVGR
jgi:DNA polymerase-3 subunit gamma/tau